MKKIIVMMLAVALAFLLTTTFAVTNDNFEFTLPSGYEVVEEKASMGMYKKDGHAFMYGVKSVFDGMRSNVLEFTTTDFEKLIKDLYEEPNPIIKSKSVVTLKDIEGVRVDIENQYGLGSSLFFANSDHVIVMLAFYGEVPEAEIDVVLQSFTMKGLSKQVAWIIAIGVIVLVGLMIFFSRGKKR